jgi:A/G-specific adenine glycosylase
MDFGALQCKPGLPDCQICVYKKSCLAFKRGEVLKYPLTLKKAPETQRFFTYIVPVIYRKGEAFTILQKRSDNDIWKNLYEFPLIESDKYVSPDEILSSERFSSLFPGTYKLVSQSGKITHKLTHQIIHAQFIRIEIEDKGKKVKMPLIRLSELKTLPVSRLTDKYLSSLDYFNL